MAIKKNEALIHGRTTWINLRNIKLSGINQTHTKTLILYDSVDKKCPEQAIL